MGFFIFDSFGERCKMLTGTKVLFRELLSANLFVSIKRVEGFDHHATGMVLKILQNDRDLFANRSGKY